LSRANAQVAREAAQEIEMAQNAYAKDDEPQPKTTRIRTHDQREHDTNRLTGANCQ